MKAVVFEEHGGTEVLSYTDIPEPEPGPYEVLIEVNLVLRVPPRELTIAIIASEMPAAMERFAREVVPLVH